MSDGLEGERAKALLSLGDVGEDVRRKLPAIARTVVEDSLVGGAFYPGPCMLGVFTGIYEIYQARNIMADEPVETPLHEIGRVYGALVDLVSIELKASRVSEVFIADALLRGKLEMGQWLQQMGQVIALDLQIVADVTEVPTS